MSKEDLHTINYVTSLHHYWVPCHSWRPEVSTHKAFTDKVKRNQNSNKVSP